tara:strand:- start:497 stop:1252 length:756 start_codon:yes stop_codon:yes gene_type:complete
MGVVGVSHEMTTIEMFGQDESTAFFASDYIKWLPKVIHTPDLDGGGKLLAPIFSSLLEGQKFNTAFEWCAGPAWIGLWLLESGICKQLVTGDINEDSVTAVRKTSTDNGYKVRSYVSNNMDDIPEREMFDLVISNPPNYCNIQLDHHFGYMRNDLRPSDVDWKIHKNFYTNIGSHLHENSVMYISEIDPYREDVYLGGALYDARPRIPMEDFTAMTFSNDLKITKEVPYTFPGTSDVDCCILEIRPETQET